VNMRNIIRKAVSAYGHETGRLEFLPENRYNRAMFPATGQYDWFSGQVLYCLVRCLRPRRILEISTSCGYATMFMSLALKENGWGMIDTHETDPKSARAAKSLFAEFGLEGFVNQQIGDARKTSRPAPSDYGIYFLDSEHTESFLRWFIEEHIMPGERIDALFHIHDILPRSARVRRWNTPPFTDEDGCSDGPGKAGGTARYGGMMRRLFRRPARNEEDDLTIKVYPPGIGRKLQTFDGNLSTEARFGNELTALMRPWEYAFLHDLAADYPELQPKKYDPYAVGRADAQGNPMEWNESLWCQAAAVREAYRKLTRRHAPEGREKRWA